MELLAAAYEAFNARDIDRALATIGLIRRMEIRR
jgi:hypothetical protein